MAITRRVVILTSSVFLMLIIAVSLASSLQLRAKSSPLIQIAHAQAVKDGKLGIEGKNRENDTESHDVDFTSGSATKSSGTASTFYLSVGPTTTDREGFIGQTPTPPSSIDEGYIGPVETQAAIPTLLPALRPQSPIFALSYAGSGGPKHCRGKLVQKLTIPRPADTWKNGSCVDLPSEARCGVFWADKNDHCEAELFTMAGCLNTTSTYVNTVVFMPEERTVGAKWSSMYVKCGVDAPEAGPLNPALLDGLLKKPGKKLGGGW